MPHFCVNKNAQSNGDHEVHQTSPSICNNLPDHINRESLGEHPTCSGAVQVAKRNHPTWRVNGCAYCCPTCNTG